LGRQAGPGELPGVRLHGQPVPGRGPELVENATSDLRNQQPNLPQRDPARLVHEGSRAANH
jgi:hypothetical protein